MAAVHSSLSALLWFRSLVAGGPGSGCTGPNCGRPKSVYGSTHELLLSHGWTYHGLKHVSGSPLTKSAKPKAMYSHPMHGTMWVGKTNSNYHESLVSPGVFKQQKLAALENFVKSTPIATPLAAPEETPEVVEPTQEEKPAVQPAVEKDGPVANGAPKDMHDHLIQKGYHFISSGASDSGQNSTHLYKNEATGGSVLLKNDHTFANYTKGQGVFNGTGLGQMKNSIAYSSGAKPAPAVDINAPPTSKPPTPVAPSIPSSILPTQAEMSPEAASMGLHLISKDFYKTATTAVGALYTNPVTHAFVTVSNTGAFTHQPNTGFDKTYKGHGLGVLGKSLEYAQAGLNKLAGEQKALPDPPTAVGSTPHDLVSWNKGQLASKVPSNENLWVGKYKVSTGVVKEAAIALAATKKPYDYSSVAFMKGVEGVKALDSLLGRAKTNQDLTVFRGIGGGYAKMVLASLQKDGKYQVDSFQGTSLHSGTSHSFSGSPESGSLILRISVPKGTPAIATTAHATAYSEEKEIVFPRDSIYTLKGVYHNGSKQFAEVDLSVPKREKTVSGAADTGGFREVPKLTPKQLLFYHVAAQMLKFTDDQLDIAFLARHGQGGPAAKFMLDALDAEIERGVAASKAMKAAASNARRKAAEKRY